MLYPSIRVYDTDTNHSFIHVDKWKRVPVCKNISHILQELSTDKMTKQTKQKMKVRSQVNHFT